MRAERTAIDDALGAVADALVADPRRPVLVRSPPGGGAALLPAVLDHDPRGALPAGNGDGPRWHVAAIDGLDDAALLALRRRARDATLVLVTEASTPGPAVARLLDYLRPRVIEPEPLDLDRVVAVLEAQLGRPVPDEHAALVRRWTAGRAGDVVAVADHQAEHALPPEAPPDLAGFAPSSARRSDWTTSGSVGPWALATVDGVTEVVAALDAQGRTPSGDVRPVDAAAVVAGLGRDREGRREAIREATDVAATLDGPLDPEALVAVGRWWCELAAPSLDAAELAHLVGGVQAAFARNRLTEARPMAERLWTTTRVPLAGVALATALGRAPADAANRELLAEIADGAGDDVLVAVAATRATWRFHADHDAAAALAALDAAPADADALVGVRATLALHLGRPDEVDGLLGDRLDAPPAGPTTFAVNALVSADLARGRHARAVERLDRELEARLDPGPNLSVDRDRFFRTVAASEAGWADAEQVAELDRTYVRALDGGDDWTIGWTGWGTGVQALRAGRFAVARRRLRTAVEAFHRAHRPGFAMWPATALVELAAIADHGPVGADVAAARAALSFDHAVVADRARAHLALAQAARASGAPAAEVADQLAVAMRAAHDAHETVTSHLVAIEQALAGLDPDDPIADPHADGVLVELAPALAAGGAAWDEAGRTLGSAGWVVLGLRLRAAAAGAAGRSDPRAAARRLQEVRTGAEALDEPLRPWVLGAERLPDLPTLSARELEVAGAVARGASRDEVAAALVVSRRTVDSHLQRIYAKLGVSSRTELRAWLDRTEP